MLSLHFLGFQVELVTEMAIPLLLGFRLLSQMSSCSHCWGTVGKIYEPLPVKRAMWIHVAEFILNVWTILNRTYIQNHSADIGVKLFWRPKPSRFFNHKKHLILHNYTDSTLKNAPFSKGSAPGCSMTEALLGSPAPEYGVRWNGKSQWRWNLFCRENTAGYRSICRLLCIYIYTYYRSAYAYLEFAWICFAPWTFSISKWNLKYSFLHNHGCATGPFFVKEGVLVLEGPILLCHDYREEI